MLFLVFRSLSRRCKTFPARYSITPPCCLPCSSCPAHRISLYTTAVECSDFTDRTSTNSMVVGEPLPNNQRVLRAAILGVPNAGKTTLVNGLLGQKLFAVSPKKHTTIRNAVGVFIEGCSQIILMDTPGIIPYQEGRKLKAPKSFLTGPQRSLMNAELVIVVVDATDKRSRHQLDPYLLQTLSHHRNIPTVLLLNKVDMVRQKHVLLRLTESITRQTEQWKKNECNSGSSNKADVPFQAQLCSISEDEPPPPSTQGETSHSAHASECDTQVPSVAESESQLSPVAGCFQAVFMVSALTGDGMTDLRVMFPTPVLEFSLEEYLVSCSRPGLWEYTLAEQSDQSQLTLVEDIVREKLFLHLHREIPYVVTQSNVIWEEEGDTRLIYQNIVCRSSRQASIVIGPAGRTIQTITAEAKADIEALLGCPVDLTLNVKSHK